MVHPSPYTMTTATQLHSSGRFNETKQTKHTLRSRRNRWKADQPPVIEKIGVPFDGLITSCISSGKYHKNHLWIAIYLASVDKGS